MSKMSAPKISPEQPALFDVVQSKEAVQYIPNEIGPQVTEQAQPDQVPTIEEGPSIDLAEYYTSLKGILPLYARMNTGDNFRKRFIEGSPIVKTVFEQRYGNPNRKYDESENTKETLEEIARYQFAQAFGREALIASGIKTEEAVDRSMEKYYQQFRLQYAGIPNSRARRNLQRRLDTRVKKLKKT